MIDGLRSVEERFWKKVKKSEIPQGCWEWTAAHDVCNYGLFTIAKKRYRSHRVSYELTWGVIPEGMYVCHRCDNPPCVRPSHLFLGTHQDNMDDRDKKGRGSFKKGNLPSQTKLTEEEVCEIRILYSINPYKGLQSELAKEFGVTVSTINNIVHNKIWKSI